MGNLRGGGIGMKNYESLIFAAKKLGGKTEQLASRLEVLLNEANKDASLIGMVVWSLRYDLLLSRKCDPLAYNKDKYVWMYNQRHLRFNHGSWMDNSYMD